MPDDTTDRVTFRVDSDRLEAVDELADSANTTRSEILRRLVDYGIEANADAVPVEVEINRLRQEIIADGDPIDKAGGFAGRVENDFLKRFRNGYGAKWLVSKAENYRREARMLEQKVPKHPDAPDVEPGELVEEVDRVLRRALEGVELSEWGGDDNPFAEVEAVEDGRSAAKLALTLTKSALRMDRELEPFRADIESERRVRAADLPALADSDLPDHVDREDVAAAARSLADRGITPDEVETDPDAAGLFQPSDLPALVSDADGLPSDAETDGGAIVVDSDSSPSETGVVADGGDNTAIQSYNDDSDPADDGGEPTGDTDDSEHMDHEPEPLPDREQIVDKLAQLYDDLGGGSKSKDMVQSKLTDPNSGDPDYMKVVDRDGLDVSEILADAVEQADADAPGTVKA